MMFLGGTPFHNNKFMLRLSVKTRLELTLNLLPLRHSFGIYLQLSSTQKCYPFLSFKYFKSCWILWYLNDLSIEKRVASFDQTLKIVVKRWDLSAQGFGELMKLWETKWCWMKPQYKLMTWEIKIKAIFFFFSKNIYVWTPQKGVLKIDYYKTIARALLK